ncbi:hypothetical protein SRABI106_02315 [Rahnella aquatilis]|nr:hypothetical protein SRABI106_02315 [Rahnella aquatilis]
MSQHHAFFFHRITDPGNINLDGHFAFTTVIQNTQSGGIQRGGDFVFENTGVQFGEKLRDVGHTTFSHFHALIIAAHTAGNYSHT